MTALAGATSEFRPMLIDGQWVDSVGGHRSATTDPDSGRVLATVPKACPADVDAAVGAARRAFAPGSAWRRTTAEERGRVVRRIGDLVLANAEELALVESMDDGKPVTFTRYADVPMAADLFHHLAGWAVRAGGEPVGVVGQILPRRSPLLMAAWKLAPALTAGCTLVLKPAFRTPLSALWLGELVEQAGVPPGVVNIVTGDRETGAALAAHPGVDRVAFTGAPRTGREIARTVPGDARRLVLEVGGNTPDLVHPDGDLAQALAGAMGRELLRDYLVTPADPPPCARFPGPRERSAW